MGVPHPVEVVGLALHGANAAHLEHEPAVHICPLSKILRQQRARFVKLLTQIPHYGAWKEKHIRSSSLDRSTAHVF